MPCATRRRPALRARTLGAAVATAGGRGGPYDQANEQATADVESDARRRWDQWRRPERRATWTAVRGSSPEGGRQPDSRRASQTSGRQAGAPARDGDVAVGSHRGRTRERAQWEEPAQAVAQAPASSSELTHPRL